MKKVFNASLLASSVALAFSAQAGAATIELATGTSYTLSDEGISVENVVDDKVIAFDVTVDADYPANSLITLTFPADAVDFSAFNAAGLACDATGGSGIQHCGTSGDGEVRFNVGNGNFSFDDVQFELDEDANEATMSYRVNLGNAITANSAYRVLIGGGAEGDYATVSDAFGLSYVAVSGGNEIDSASEDIAKIDTQYAVAVESGLAGRIDRDPRTQFVNDTSSNNVTTTGDAFVLSIEDKELEAAAELESITVRLYGDFTQGYDANDGGAADSVYNGMWELAGAGLTATAGVVETGGQSIVFEDVAVTAVADIDEVTVTFDNGTDLIDIDPMRFSVDVDLTFGGEATDSETRTYLEGEDVGQWRVDGTLVNVPYMPVGYGLTAQVEIANMGSTDAEIYLEAIDNETGERIRSTEPLVQEAEANSVTTIHEGHFREGLNLLETDKRKLSITFIIDANEPDITVTPYYGGGAARVIVPTSQYRTNDANL